MKKIIFIASLLATTFTSYSQCEELFITEIVFGQNGSYSVEVFNPTSQTKQLAAYTIQLLGSGVSPVDITLTGTVAPHSTVVISELNSITPITNVTDILTLLLDFQGKSVIQLLKNQTQVLDRIGNIYPSSTIIDINQLLTNPNYLNGINIDLGSITNLLIRRQGVIQQGKVNFVNTDIIDDWEIYPNTFIQNLGLHTNACMNPVIEWNNASMWSTELTINENDPSAIIGDISITGNLSSAIELSIVPLGGSPNVTNVAI